MFKQVRAEDRDEQMEMSKLELVRALHVQPRNQVRGVEFSVDNVCMIFMVCVKKICELQQQMRTKERELTQKVNIFSYF